MAIKLTNSKTGDKNLLIIIVFVIIDSLIVIKTNDYNCN